MKGVILAGGLGTRLLPLTRITNKHLLPIYDRPMITYPIDTLRKSGITDILIVCGRAHVGHFMDYLGSGREMSIKLSYALQDKDSGGIADALSYAEDFCDGKPVAVILGDNIYEDTFKPSVSKFKKGGMIFLKKVSDPQRFGVAVFDTAGKKIVRIEEKPKVPKSDFAQTGLYLFGGDVFSIIKKLKPSDRGELEVTDIVNTYNKRGQLSFAEVHGFWSDAGTFDSLIDSGDHFAQKAKEGRRK